MDVVESEWGRGADLDVLASKLAEDTAHTIKAVCIVHNETATGVTNNLAAVRKLLGKNLVLDLHSCFRGDFKCYGLIVQT